MLLIDAIVGYCNAISLGIGAFILFAKGFPFLSIKTIELLLNHIQVESTLFIFFFKCTITALCNDPLRNFFLCFSSVKEPDSLSQDLTTIKTLSPYFASRLFLFPNT